MTTKPLAVSLDLGATKLRACIGKQSGRILRRLSREMSTTGTVEDYLEMVVQSTKEIFQQSPKSEIEAIGLASFGPLDLTKGIIRNPPNVPFKNVPIVDSLKDSFDIEVVLVNDANAAVIGERYCGAGKNSDNLVYVTISTGIGAGVFVDGNLLIGKDGNAAEAGHMTINPASSLTCGCGRKGHWEAYCSGRNIPNFAKFLYDDLSESKKQLYRNSPIAMRSTITTREIFREARRGDRLARFVVQEIGKLNSLGVANLVSMYDPTLVTIGGGVALRNARQMLNPIRNSLMKYTINRAPKIILTPLGEDICLLGALTAAFNPSILHK